MRINITKVSESLNARFTGNLVILIHTLFTARPKK